jgi:hypothetical protein
MRMHPSRPALVSVVLLLALPGCAGAAGDGPFALDFAGGEDCVEVDMDGVTPPDVWTVELWIRGSGASADAPRPLAEWKGVFNLGQLVGGDTGFSVGPTDGLSWGTSVLDGDLHHVAGTFDGEKATLFVDGVKQAFADGSPAEDVTSTLRLGCNASSNAYLGLMDEVRLSSVVRYDSDFDRPVTAFTEDADTVALYHFDEGAGETAEDSSGDRDASVYGPQWVEFDLAEGG